VFIGHFGVALAAKKAAPKVSLGVLFLAAQFADILWPVFLLLGWEQVRISPGITRFTPFDFVSYPYSHSLVAQLLWGAALGAVYFVFRRDSRGALVAAACVPSHWLLDYITHRPDMPIVPHGARYGLGLWNSVGETFAAEIALYAIGIALYLTVTRARDTLGEYALWSLLILLFALYIGSAFGAPPSSEQVLGYSALGIWLTVPWAAWADYHRSPKPA
jgi:membrane-bound metal-dependent hydrolase YbcI (DUF457 family)